MTENEIKVLKMNLLGGMHSFMISGVQDEVLQDVWLTYGIPDEPTEEDLESIAEDYEVFSEIVRLFGLFVREDYRTNS